MGSYVVLRLRGPVKVRGKVEDTMHLLNLPRRYHATIVPDNDSFKGMLKKVKDYVTWGPATHELVKELLEKRGKVVGGKSFTISQLEGTGLGSAEKVYEAIAQGRLRLKDIDRLKPVFRLHPPLGGFKGSTKKGISEGGETGYRENISPLILRMI